MSRHQGFELRAVLALFLGTTAPSHAAAPPAPAAPAPRPTATATAAASEVPDLALAIEFDGLPSCVDESTVERRVTALVRPDWLNSARRVRGTIVPAGAGWVVQFRVFEGEVLVGRRRLEFESADCAPFQEAVEVVVAMLLEGQGFEVPSAEEAGSGEPTPAPAPDPATPAEGAPADAQRQPSRRVMGRFRLGGEVSFGVMPNVSAGVRLEGGIELAAPLAILARASWHMDGGASVAGGGHLDFSGYRLALTACYLYRRGWVLSACAGLGFVSLTATGVDVPGARSAGFDQGAGVFGLSARVPLTRSWSLEFGAELEAWFSRPEYVLIGVNGDEVIWASSGVPVATWLAIGYSF